MNIAKTRLGGLLWIGLCAGVCALGWQQYQEGRREIADSNAAVEADIGRYLPVAFAAMTETVTSNEPLTPSTIYTGNGSRIVAFNKRTEDRLFDRDMVSWDILAQSKSGAYFEAVYDLCVDCGSDVQGADRLRKSSWPVRSLTADRAKDWLFRAGLRKEFKAEFGTDAPPATVQG